MKGFIACITIQNKVNSHTFDKNSRMHIYGYRTNKNEKLMPFSAFCEGCTTQRCK